MGKYWLLRSTQQPVLAYFFGLILLIASVTSFVVKTEFAQNIFKKIQVNSRIYLIIQFK